MFSAPLLAPLVLRRAGDYGSLCRCEHARRPWHALGHRSGPDLLLDRPWPHAPRCLPHGLWIIARPSRGPRLEVRIPWAGRVISLELEPALSKRVDVYVEGEATLLRAEGPDAARSLNVRAASHLGPGRPPALTFGPWHAACIVVCPAGSAAFRRVRYVE